MLSIAARGRIPVIVLTRPAAFAERAARCREFGAAAVIAKPVSPGMIAEGLRAALAIGAAAAGGAGTEEPDPVAAQSPAGVTGRTPAAQV